MILVEDTSEDPSWLPNPLLPETQSEVAVPIASGDNVLGVLDVQENRKSGFSAQAVELLQAIANQTAIAVQNTRLYNMAQRKAENETRANLISQKIQSATTIESSTPGCATRLERGAERPTCQRSDWIRLR